MWKQQHQTRQLSDTRSLSGVISPRQPYKAELVGGPEHPGPLKTVEELELVTLGWVHWQNNERLHMFIGGVPPAEFEKACFAEIRQARALAENIALGSL